MARGNFDQQYFEAAQEAAFERCVDYLTSLIEKYGDIVAREIEQAERNQESDDH